ncbi:MAG: hypothetical protein U0941_10135 [Planctomycetaceae bacterium]
MIRLFASLSLATVIIALAISGCNQPNQKPSTSDSSKNPTPTKPTDPQPPGPKPKGDVLPTLAEISKLEQDSEASAKVLGNAPLDFGWAMFLYTNWPAKADERGVPDPAKKPGDAGPVVWETWKNVAEVFLDKGAEPPDWNTPPVVPPAVAAITPPASDSGPMWQRMTESIQVDGFPTKDDSGETVLYNVFQNKSVFDYIRTNELYNVQGQIAVAAGSGPIPKIDFPWTAMEVKASWRWLDPEKDQAKIARYFTAPAYWAELDDDGNFVKWRTGLMGLTGLHIISKDLPTWVWITFEQVDNGTWTNAKRKNPIPAKVQEVNSKMQKLLAGTKFANYELVGVQTSFMSNPSGPVDGTSVNNSDPGKGGSLLANTQIESAFQSRSSCITCHSIASIAKKLPENPEDLLRKSFVEVGVTPPYYVGESPDLAPFVSMDFAWSLRRAKLKQ